MISILIRQFDKNCLIDICLKAQLLWIYRWIPSPWLKQQEKKLTNDNWYFYWGSRTVFWLSFHRRRVAWIPRLWFGCKLLPFLFLRIVSLASYALVLFLFNNPVEIYRVYFYIDISIDIYMQYMIKQNNNTANSLAVVANLIITRILRNSVQMNSWVKDLQSWSWKAFRRLIALQGHSTDFKLFRNFLIISNVFFIADSIS